MKIEIDHTLDSVKDGLEEIGEIAHAKTNEFHNKFVSKVIPDCGKYGDAVKFAAELVPGVSEYNAIKEGDWQAFAISAGIDVAALAIGAATAGAGYATLKGSTAVAKAGVKAATREIAEAGTKKVVKETVEAGVEKIAKGATEFGTEKVVKETLEVGTEKAVKETGEQTTKEITEKVVLETGDKIDKRRFSEYMTEIEKITKREIPKQQKEMVEKTLKERDFVKLDKEEVIVKRGEFSNSRKKLIEKWEEETGEEWPRYLEDVVNENGIVIRRAGDFYDAHHIIELKVGGPNEWWNLHPAKFPDEHQKGIHATGKLSEKIFG